MPSEQMAEHLKAAARCEKAAEMRLRPKNHDYEGGAVKPAARAAEAQAFATLALSHRTAVQTEVQFEEGRN